MILHGLTALLYMVCLSVIYMVGGIPVLLGFSLTRVLCLDVSPLGWSPGTGRFDPPFCPPWLQHRTGGIGWRGEPFLLGFGFGRLDFPELHGLFGQPLKTREVLPHGAATSSKSNL